MDSLTLYHSTFSFKSFELALLASDEALYFVGNTSEVDEYKEWFEKKLKLTIEIIKSETKLHPYKEQLLEYFQGDRKNFTFPIQVVGTDFQKQVLSAMSNIPFGDTSTYGDLAQSIGKQAQAARAVGGAVGTNPLMIVLPCHRILSKDRKLTGFRGGIQLKEFLLDLENVSYKL